MFEAREVARGVDLPPEYGNLLAADAERQIDAESMSAFAKEYNLSPETPGKTEEGETEEAEGEPTEAPAGAGSTQLAGMSGGSSSAGDGGQGGLQEQTMTRPEWYQLKKSNPAAAAEALRQGRVQVDPTNPYLNQPEEAEGNPYVARVSTE